MNGVASPAETPTAEGRGADVPRWTLRMKDLSEATGLTRQVIHFYIREGLVPPGEKATRNSAFYGDIHLERLALIKRLQSERFLPLRAIRAVIDESDGAFTPEQQQWIAELKAEAARAAVVESGTPRRGVEVEALLAEHGVTRAELRELADAGFVGIASSPEHGERIAADDAWVVGVVGELRRAGLTAERGFDVSDLAIYEDAVARLFAAETALVLRHIKNFRASEAAPLIARVLPLLGTLLTRHHEARVRRFLEAMT